MDPRSLITQPIRAELDAFRDAYTAALRTDRSLLADVVGHIAKGQGKGMRPILVLLAAKLCGAVNPTTYRVAVALELFHTASLMHDDVVDESDERRGFPSVKSAFSNQTAILSGDYLLASALTHVAETERNDLVSMVARLGKRLAEGELTQLSLHRAADYTEATYMDIIDHKTATLFAACAEAGAASVNACDEMVKNVHSIGRAIGQCFQIKDDLFDYFPNPQIGKPTGKDMAEGKLTLPVINALGQTNDVDAHEAANRVAAHMATADDIALLTNLAIHNGGIDYATQVMDRIHRDALTRLATFDDTPVRRALEAYIDYVVSREK